MFFMDLQQTIRELGKDKWQLSQVKGKYAHFQRGRGKSRLSMIVVIKKSISNEISGTKTGWWFIIDVTTRVSSTLIQFITTTFKDK